MLIEFLREFGALPRPANWLWPGGSPEAAVLLLLDCSTPSALFRAGSAP